MEQTMHTHSGDADGAPDPGQMHALMQSQRRVVVDAQTSFVRGIEISWGLAWIFGYTALWLIDGSDAVRLPRRWRSGSSPGCS